MSAPSRLNSPPHRAAPPPPFTAAGLPPFLPIHLHHPPFTPTIETCKFMSTVARLSLRWSQRLWLCLRGFRNNPLKVITRLLKGPVTGLVRTRIPCRLFLPVWPEICGRIVAQLVDYFIFSPLKPDEDILRTQYDFPAPSTQYPPRYGCFTVVYWVIEAQGRPKKTKTYETSPFPPTLKNVWYITVQ